VVSILCIKLKLIFIEYQTVTVNVNEHWNIDCSLSHGWHVGYLSSVGQFAYAACFPAVHAETVVGGALVGSVVTREGAVVVPTIGVHSWPLHPTSPFVWCELFLWLKVTFSRSSLDIFCVFGRVETAGQWTQTHKDGKGLQKGWGFYLRSHWSKYY